MHVYDVQRRRPPSGALHTNFKDLYIKVEGGHLRQMPGQRVVLNQRQKENLKCIQTISNVSGE